MLRTDQSFTVSAWVNLSTLPAYNVTAVAQDGVTASGFYLQYAYYTGQPPRWQLLLPATDTTNPATHAVSAATASTGWTHLVAVYDAAAGTAKLYVNGQLAATASGLTTIQTSGSLTVGRGRWNGQAVDRFPGTIDDVQVWQGVLSDREIAHLL